jgi:carboxymethylenebutenolidase
MNNRTNSLFVLSILLIITPSVLSTNFNSVYKIIPYAHAQTNDAALATLAGNMINNSTTNTSAPASNNAGLEIKTGVNYFNNASGYLVYPSTVTNTSTTSSKKLPAVIMIHENRGLNDNIKNMANTLSKEGYAVLAVDLFKGQVAATSDQARQLAGSVRSNPTAAIANLQSAVRYVSSLPFVDSSKIASIGWCFGGGQSLQLALHSDQHPLAATILYYGTPLVTDTQQLSKIKWPVLGIFGDKDQAIPLTNIQQFKAALNSDNITNEIHIYAGLGHAFANPSGTNYAPKETADAWGQKTLSFLKKYV